MTLSKSFNIPRLGDIAYNDCTLRIMSKTSCMIIFSSKMPSGNYAIITPHVAL
jgi:hypothetical protein